ncbi:hypothetical protein [Streptomyces spectabilis]|uniref:Uncharacterized protein n=1 Tax=Streptomyces spectabilis TaxID=68270 RepID=A0A7W8ERI4_STRST|nr:hypothetical protein [Streptomyces spectabilis]MBB5101471.1 hypothetical protein [Streptomyces spectabilis]MCI3900663.1 hypothetical protein [Streptomyces spectabilis]GGV11633.1 hypothetical protein GCM10010245_21550 [Streptomyces spectabilis]
MADDPVRIRCGPGAVREVPRERRACHRDLFRPRTTRADAADHFRELAAGVVSDPERARTDTVVEHGLITGFHVYEDSLAIAAACTA